DDEQLGRLEFERELRFGPDFVFLFAARVADALLGRQRDGDDFAPQVIGQRLASAAPLGLLGFGLVGCWHRLGLDLGTSGLGGRELREEQRELVGRNLLRFGAVHLAQRGHVPLGQSANLRLLLFDEREQYLDDLLLRTRLGKHLELRAKPGHVCRRAEHALGHCHANAIIRVDRSRKYFSSGIDAIFVGGGPARAAPRASEIDAFENEAELSRFHLAGGLGVLAIPRQAKAPALEALSRDRKAITGPEQNADVVATPIERDEQMAAARVLAQALLDEQRKPVVLLAQVDRRGRDEDFHRWRQRQHATDSSAASTSSSVSLQK